MSNTLITLIIFLPTEKFLDQKVGKVKGESPDGEFCLKPNHIDYATALVPGIFSYLSQGGKECFIAVDQGILLKQGESVTIATRRAVAGNLGQLDKEVEKMLNANKEREKQNRSAVAKLEIGFVKRILEFSHRS